MPRSARSPSSQCRTPTCPLSMLTPDAFVKKEQKNERKLEITTCIEGCIILTNTTYRLRISRLNVTRNFAQELARFLRFKIQHNIVIFGPSLQLRQMCSVEFHRLENVQQCCQGTIGNKFCKIKFTLIRMWDISNTVDVCGIGKNLTRTIERTVQASNKFKLIEIAHGYRKEETCWDRFRLKRITVWCQF